MGECAPTACPCGAASLRSRSGVTAQLTVGSRPSGDQRQSISYLEKLSRGMRSLYNGFACRAWGSQSCTASASRIRYCPTHYTLHQTQASILPNGALPRAFFIWGKPQTPLGPRTPKGTAVAYAVVYLGESPQTPRARPGGTVSAPFRSLRALNRFADALRSLHYAPHLSLPGRASVGARDQPPRDPPHGGYQKNRWQRRAIAIYLGLDCRHPFPASGLPFAVRLSISTYGYCLRSKALGCYCCNRCWGGFGQLPRSGVPVSSCALRRSWAVFLARVVFPLSWWLSVSFCSCRFPSAPAQPPLCASGVLVSVSCHSFIIP